jgi:hypothetical protein
MFFSNLFFNCCITGTTLMLIETEDEEKVMMEIKEMIGKCVVSECASFTCFSIMLIAQALYV